MLENLDGATRKSIANLKAILEDKTNLEALIGSVINREASALVYGLWVGSFSRDLGCSDLIA